MKKYCWISRVNCKHYGHFQHQWIIDTLMTQDNIDRVLLDDGFDKLYELGNAKRSKKESDRINFEARKKIEYFLEDRALRGLFDDEIYYQDLGNS